MDQGEALFDSFIRLSISSKTNCITLKIVDSFDSKLNR